MAGAPTLTEAMRYRDFRLLLGAFTLADIGSWSYNVALTVWVFEATGSVGWVAAAAACRFVPALLFSAWAGVVAERHDKARFLRAVDLLFAAVMSAMALAMTAGAPVLLVLGIAAVSSTLGTTVEPAAAALTPHVVPEGALASANALRTTIDNLTVVAGPALGALLLLSGPPQNAVWVTALGALASAGLVSRVTTRAPGIDTTASGGLGAVEQLVTGLRAVTENRSVVVLVGYSVLATLVFGTDTVLYVAVSDDVLGTGPDGYGYLLAGLGLGGLLAAPLVTRAETLPALGPVILAGMAGYCLPTLLLLVSDQPAAAFACQVVRGASTLFVDVLAVTALQRSLPGDVMARVFGVVNSLVLAAILAGSLLTSWVVAVAGVDAAIWLCGAGLFAVSLLGVPGLREMDRAAAERRASLAPRLALLESCDLVEDVGDGALTQLADGAEEVTLPAATVVLEEGRPADAFYVVVAGTLAVTSTGSGGPLPDLHAGDHFGELGLLERIPRTATVTATTDVRLLRIEGAAFLAALTTARPSVALHDGAALRLARTHPALAVGHRGLEQEGRP